MRKPIRAVGAGLLFAAAALVLAADPPAPPPADLAKQLGDRDYRTREDATKKLWELGEAARPALEAALKDGNPEAVSRAQKILDKFNRGILPDTPKDLLNLIDKFITATEDENIRFDTARKLMDRGPAGIAALARQLRKGFGSPDERNYFFISLQTHLRRAVPVLLFDGKDTQAEQLLRLNTYGPKLSAQLDYAVFMAQRGKAKELLEQATEARTLPGDVGKAGDLALLCAYRVAGEPAKLKTLLAQMTKDAKEPVEAEVEPVRNGRPLLASLREELLIDTGDWAALADEPPGVCNTPDGLKAFRLRAAGKGKEADALLAEVKESDVADVGGYAIETGALALLLNGKTEDGIARLKASESAPHVLTDMQAVRLEFKEAMDAITAGLATKPKRGPDDDLPGGTRMADLYLAKKGRILGQLGQRDAAVQVFTKMAETLDHSDGVALLQLLKAEFRSGFPDLAAELLGNAQANYDSGNTSNPFQYTNSQDPYEVLFEGDAEAAVYWWRVLRQSRPKDTGAKRMLTVRKLLTGRLPAADAKKLLDEASKLKPLPQSDRRGRRFDDGDSGRSVITPYLKAVGTATAQRILGDTAAATATLTEYSNKLKNAKQPKMTTDDEVDDIEYPSNGREPGNRLWVFGVSESFRAWQDLGELLMQAKKPKEAAAVLLDGWRQTPGNGLLLYYSGRALLLAGNEADEKEGKRRVALSHLVSLANVRMRGRFLEELANRSEPADDLRNERDATRLCAWLPYPECNGNVWNQIARVALMLKDYAGGVEANRRAIHYVLRTSGVTYVEGYAYVNVVATLRGVEARQYLAEGKVAEALAAARESLLLLPTNTDLVIALVAGLEKANRKADADALYAQTRDALGKVLKDHPDSAWARHLSGWLASGCRRELTDALANAKKAAELEPDSKAHRSGLAEAHFRNGQREKAVELMAKLATEDRRNHFYQRQLDRYKTAAFDSALPNYDDD